MSGLGQGWIIDPYHVPTTPSRHTTSQLLISYPSQQTDSFKEPKLDPIMVVCGACDQIMPMLEKKRKLEEFKHNNYVCVCVCAHDCKLLLNTSLKFSLYKLYTWKLNHGQKIWDKKDEEVLLRMS
jgi:hypothetical protein